MNMWRGTHVRFSNLYKPLRISDFRTQLKQIIEFS